MTQEQDDEGKDWVFMKKEEITLHPQPNTRAEGEGHIIGPIFHRSFLHSKDEGLLPLGIFKAGAVGFQEPSSSCQVISRWQPSFNKFKVFQSI